MEANSCKTNKSLLMGVGKATSRGLRKCRICGTFNGTRKLFCKNTLCSSALINAETGEVKKSKITARQLKTCVRSSKKVYSIHVCDENVEYYGFVQLSNSESVANDPDVCFVESCQNSYNKNGMNHEMSILEGKRNACMHVQVSKKCSVLAAPYSVKTSEILDLPTTEDVKQNILQLTLESTTPLVQRIAETVFVIRCKPNSKHPLGYLHFIIFFNNVNGETHLYYSCQCTEFQMYLKEEGDLKRCLHYYICLCVVKSDSNLRREFAQFLNLENLQLLPMMLTDHADALDNKTSELVKLFEKSAPKIKLQLLELNRENTSNSSRNEHNSKTYRSRLYKELLNDSEIQNCMQIYDWDERVDSNYKNSSLKQEKSQSNSRRGGDAHSSLMNCKRKIISTEHTNKKQKNDVSAALTGSKNVSQLPTVSGINCDETFENNCSISFYQWLASVAERINYQMHYQFSGKLQTLIFHTQQKFFDCLLERISVERNNKRRLPNSTVAFTHTGSLPIGTFTRFTWYITNIIHVEQIFDNPYLPLKLTRSFVENDDGTYRDLTESKMVSSSSFSLSKKMKTQTNPIEYKTFLKVGNVTPNQNEPVPFVIEWIPDILPITKIGILKITFEYGHLPPIE